MTTAPNALPTLLPKKEARAIHYFRQHALAELIGFFDSQFWAYTVLQRGQAQLAIHHGLVALAALHEALYSTLGEKIQDTRTGPAYKFALEQYSRSIKLVTVELSNSRIENTLICCVLFVCFECAQGNQDAALSHLQNGLTICSQWMGSRDLSDCESQICQVLSRLDDQATIYHNDKWYPRFLLEIPHELQARLFNGLSTLDEAREMFNKLYKLILQFAIKASLYKVTSKDCIPHSIVVEYDYLNLQLQHFNASFDSLVTTSHSSIAGKDLRSAIVLKIHHKAVSIIHKNSLFLQTYSIDELVAEYKAIVTLAKSLIKGTTGLSSSKGAAISAFNLDVGLIPVLYYTSFHCPSSEVRKEAIALLYSYSTREGLWDSHTTAQIAERALADEQKDPRKHHPPLGGVIELAQHFGIDVAA